METRRLRLRSIKCADLAHLFYWRNTESYRTRFNEYNVVVPTYEHFLKEYQKEKVLRKHEYLIELKRELFLPIGIIFTHSYSTRHGYCSINVFIEEQYESLGHGVEAFGLLLIYLFDSLHVHKVYVDVYEYNALSLSTIRSSGFIEEGRFKDHHLHEGKRYDLLRFAVYREAVEKFRKIIKYYQKNQHI